MANSSRVFELRTYRAAPGKFDALVDRFRNHTLTLFERHGLNVVGFWVPDPPEGQSPDTLIYLLAFDDKAAAAKAWGTFRTDPDWAELLKVTEADGRLAESIEGTFLMPTDFSPLV